MLNNVCEWRVGGGAFGNGTEMDEKPPTEQGESGAEEGGRWMKDVENKNWPKMKRTVRVWNR